MEKTDKPDPKLLRKLFQGAIKEDELKKLNEWYHSFDENQDLAVRYGVMSIPTIAKFVGGRMEAQVVGARGADALGRELGIAG